MTEKDILVYKDLIEELKADITTGMKKFNIPGVSIALVEKKSILWTEGFGFTSISRPTEVTPDTLFLIGSLAKAYTATAFLIAVQKGLVELDDPLRKFYPDFSVKTRIGDEELNKITFRHLLTHYSGLQHNSFIYDRNGNFLSFEDYIKRSKDTWLKYPVGTRHSYSNIAYDLVAFALQEITGEPFEDFVEDEIYSPLGMRNSCVGTAKALQFGERLARGHIGERETPIEHNLGPELASGCQYSTVRDMANYLRFHFNKGKVNGNQLLKEELLTEMYSPPNLVNHQLIAIGMGIGVVRSRYGGHLSLSFFGDGPGYCCSHIFLPEIGVGMLMQTNQVENTILFQRDIIIKAMTYIVETKLEKELDDININDRIGKRNSISLSETHLRNLEGRYISRMLNVDFLLKNSTMTLNLRGKDIQLNAHSKTEFSSPETPIVKFRLNPNNKPQTITILDSQGSLTMCDYDHSPTDEFGPNRDEWKKFEGFYSVNFFDTIYYVAFLVENGYPKVISNWGLNSRLHEYRPSIFFTADGLVFSFENDNVIMDNSIVKRIELSLDDLELQIKNDPENPKFTKPSLQNLTEILKIANKLDEAEKIVTVTKKLFLEENK